MKQEEKIFSVEWNFFFRGSAGMDKQRFLMLSVFFLNNIKVWNNVVDFGEVFFIFKGIYQDLIKISVWIQFGILEVWGNFFLQFSVLLVSGGMGKIFVIDYKKGFFYIFNVSSWIQIGVLVRFWWIFLKMGNIFSRSTALFQILMLFRKGTFGIEGRCLFIFVDSRRKKFYSIGDIFFFCFIIFIYIMKENISLFFLNRFLGN